LLSKEFIIFENELQRLRDPGLKKPRAQRRKRKTKKGGKIPTKT
jgi:hypothetical protein